jgi:transcriptional regulator with XRE-family HTH domain
MTDTAAAPVGEAGLAPKGAPPTNGELKPRLASVPLAEPRRHPIEDVPHYVPVGHALRAWRLRAGTSQRRLAELTYDVVGDDARRAHRERRPPQWKQGLSQYAVNRFENGVHSPLPHNAALLASALNLALEHAGLPDRVTVATLQAGSTAQLLAFLLAEQEKFPPSGTKSGAQAFWGHLGISTQRVGELQGGAPWTAEELGAVALTYPPLADAVRDALIDQTRRQRGLPPLRSFAVRDRGHPQYTPSRPSKGGQAHAPASGTLAEVPAHPRGEPSAQPGTPPGARAGRPRPPAKKSAGSEASR